MFRRKKKLLHRRMKELRGWRKERFRGESDDKDLRRREPARSWSRSRELESNENYIPRRRFGKQNQCGATLEL